MSQLASEMRVRGARWLSGYLDRTAQKALVEDIRDVVRLAPLRHPITPGGRKMSVRMSAAGEFGWSINRNGYHYAPIQDDGSEWPQIPEALLRIWSEVVPEARLPESCLINFYHLNAKMGMHQDRDEGDLTQPVLSISLGDEARFRIGGLERGGKTESFWLRSGDVLVLDGDARMAFHGVDRIRGGSSDLLRDGGRINLTMRVVS